MIYLLLTVSLLVAYFPMFSWMFARFSEHGSYYAHGYLIPLISMYLIWIKWKELKKISLTSSFSGLILIIIGLFFYVFGGIILKIGFISGISFVIVFLGLLLYLFGNKISRALLFPVLFLLFMVPVPQVLLIAITFQMKMMAAKLAVFILSFLKISIYRAGSLIYLPNGILKVEDECSGISSLISLITLSLFFAYIAEKNNFKRLSLIFFSIPIALVANVCRILFLILASYIYGVEVAANGFLHYMAGITLWLTALIMLISIRKLFECFQ